MAHKERKLRTTGSVWNPGAVFLTAANVDSMVLNKYFLYLQDWEFTDDSFDSCYVLLNSTTLPAKIHGPTVPPFTLPSQNEFTNSTLEEINTFVRTHEPSFKGCGLMTSLWLVIDQQGLEDLTCILVEQDSGENEATREFEYRDTYRAVRLPCAEVWSAFANLDIGNMDFEEFADVDAGLGADGTFRCLDDYRRGGEIKKRDEAVKVLRKLGHV